MANVLFLMFCFRGEIGILYLLLMLLDLTSFSRKITSGMIGKLVCCNSVMQLKTSTDGHAGKFLWSCLPCFLHMQELFMEICKICSGHDR